MPKIPTLQDLELLLLDKQVRLSYTKHRKNARHRGIRFDLTFRQWLCIWLRSKHFHERGPKKGQYVMARLRDQGSYSLGNVRICTAEENHAERWARPEIRKAHLARQIGNTHWLGKRHKQETKNKLSAKFKGKRIGFALWSKEELAARPHPLLGKKHSKKTRKLLSEKALAQHRRKGTHVCK